MTTINLIESSDYKQVQFVGVSFTEGLTTTDTLNTHNITLGEYQGVGAAVNNKLVRMTQRQYDNIVAFKGEAITYDADTEIEFPETNAQLKTDINTLGLSIAGIFKRLTRIEATSDVFYTSFIVRGRELQCFTGDRGKSICSVNLATNFIGCQTPLNPEDLEDSRQVLTIQTALGKITLHVANTGELGRINDAVQANSEIPVNSIPLPTT